MFRFGVVLACCLFSACVGQEGDTSRPHWPLLAGLPVPSSVDALLVNGRPLTIDGFQALRTKFPTRSKEDVLWIAQSALVLEDSAKQAGKTLSLTSGVILAAFALGIAPEEEARAAFQEYGSNPSSAPEFKAHIEKLARLAVVQRNPQVLAELH